MLPASDGAQSPSIAHSATALMPWAAPYMIMAKTRNWMLLVSEIATNVIVRSVKARMMGILHPALSASFPDGMRDSILVIPLIPKRRAIRDEDRRRFSWACRAKRVMKKAFVKEKARRR